MILDARKLNPRSLSTFHLTPENTADVDLNKILEMGKGIWGKFEPVTKADIRSIEALHTDLVIFEIYIEQMRKNLQIVQCKTKHCRFHDN